MFISRGVILIPRLFLVHMQSQSGIFYKNEKAGEKQ